MRKLHRRDAARTDGPLLFLPVANNLLVSSATRLKKKRKEGVRHGGASVSKAPRQGDDVILVCPHAGDQVVVISGPIASPLFLGNCQLRRTLLPTSKLTARRS